jgi:hypothetical protein
MWKDKKRKIIGYIHLPALPAAPRSSTPMGKLIDFACREAEILEQAGVDGLILENSGDYPHYKDNVPPATISSMAIITKAVVEKKHKLAIGVNVLRNDCEAALSVAHVCGAQFIRCNIVTGTYATEQGFIESCAHRLARLKKYLSSDVEIFADVHVKYAYPLYNVPIEDATISLAEKGGVDAIIVSGTRSPVPPPLEKVKKVKEAVDLPVFVGSGVYLENLKDFSRVADGVIVGEAPFKIGKPFPGKRSDLRAYKKAVKIFKQ